MKIEEFVLKEMEESERRLVIISGCLITNRYFNLNGRFYKASLQSEAVMFSLHCKLYITVWCVCQSRNAWKESEQA